MVFDEDKPDGREGRVELLDHAIPLLPLVPPQRPSGRLQSLPLEYHNPPFFIAVIALVYDLATPPKTEHSATLRCCCLAIVVTCMIYLDVV